MHEILSFGSRVEELVKDAKNGSVHTFTCSGYFELFFVSLIFQAMNAKTVAHISQGNIVGIIWKCH